MMRCPHCGRTEIPEGSTFCTGCGGGLEPPRTGSGPARVEGTESSLIIDYDDVPPRRPHGLRVVAIAGAGLLVLGVGAWLTLSTLGAAPTSPAPRQARAPAAPPVVPQANSTAAPPPSTPLRRVESGTLSLNSTPWGRVSIDGQPVGNTPVIDLRVSAGSHRISVEHLGFQRYERTVTVVGGQRLLITNIELAPAQP